jgi:hypothetical protein
MANKRICIQIDYNGPSPFVLKSGGTQRLDRRLSVINLRRLLYNIDKGGQFRGGSLAGAGATTVVVQDTLVQATGTVTMAAVVAADTVTFNGTALTATQLKAKGTLTISAGAGADGGTINGALITVTWATSDTATATALAAAINTSVDPRIAGVVSASSAAGVVTIWSNLNGTIGNAITLVASGTGVTASGANLAGGAAPANNQFDPTGTNNQTAADFVRAFNASTTTALTQNAVASAVNAVVTLTSKQPGLAGNTLTLVSSNGGRLAVSGATLTGGSASNTTQWKF